MKKARTVIEPSDSFDKDSVDEDWETKGGKQLLDDKLLVVEDKKVRRLRIIHPSDPEINSNDDAFIVLDF